LSGRRTKASGGRTYRPLYAAALHARLRCQACLVVVAPDAGVARWARAPIDTLQPGSPFTPLVIEPDQIPRVSRERARREPWMAVLSALAHGNSPGGVAVVLAALDAVSGMPYEHAKVCFDLIRGSLNEAAGRALENEMQHGKYEYKSDFARRYVGEGLERGREEGQLQMARTLLLQLARDRFGLSGDGIRRPIEACGDVKRLTTLFSQIGAASDREAAERLVAELAPRRARIGSHRSRRPARAPRARAARR
jgi:hypothetical protein